MNLLQALREFGDYLVVGIHDDASYFELKKKRPIQFLSERMAQIKPLVDQIYVIPATDPTAFIRNMVSEQDDCCYVRGEDMRNFPGRDFVESVMPVYFLPRSQGVSSTLVRTLYHSGEQAAQQAAFARTDDTGKPVVAA